MCRGAGILGDDLENPGDEKHVAQACLDCTGAWEKVIRDRISDSSETQLVATFVLLKKCKDALSALSLGVVEINPRQSRQLSPRPYHLRTTQPAQRRMSPI
jgi:hypothetical protein